MNSLPNFPGGFCVLMALYGGDKPHLFEKAVASVFVNSLLPNQYLIVIDGPISSALTELIIVLKDKYPIIEFVQLPQNVGLANALNEALKLIRYPWVVRADADDINLQNRFEVQAQALAQQPHLKLLGSSILELDESGKPLTIRHVPCTESEIRIFAKLRNPFNHMSVVYSLDAIQACGGYPDIFLKEDYGLWCLFLAKQFPVANINDILVHASGGIDMFRRRGGWRYAKSEKQIQLLLVKCGLKSRWRSLIDGSLRAVFFLIPARAREYLYTQFLREKMN
jgi:glycosyltransferase involved in cell wall biosynthesis